MVCPLRIDSHWTRWLTVVALLLGKTMVALVLGTIMVVACKGPDCLGSSHQEWRLGAQDKVTGTDAEKEAAAKRFAEIGVGEIQPNPMCALQHNWVCCGPFCCPTIFSAAACSTKRLPKPPPPPPAPLGGGKNHLWYDTMWAGVQRMKFCRTTRSGKSMRDMGKKG